VSFLTCVALTTAVKTKILKRLAEVYTEELLKCIADAEYKNLAPDQQIATQNELSHWYQRWFYMVPDPTKSCLDNEDWRFVDTDDVPAVNYSPNTNNYSYWSELARAMFVGPQDQNPGVAPGQQRR
jgi:hypothetical protein